jgi:hypothetical protein
MKEDPAPDAKCRDKFLVQSVAVAADKEFNNVGSLVCSVHVYLRATWQYNPANISKQWSHIEQTNKASIQEKKIRVAFLPADASTPAAKTNGVGNVAAVTPSQHSPSPDASALHHTAVTGLESPKPVSDATTRSPAPDSPATFSNALPTSVDDVKAQLAAAQEKIVQLTAKASEEGQLRRRKGAEVLEAKGYPNAAQAVAHPTQVGVPLKWVAILVLIFFFLGWKVFK